ncbi:MAG TPA: single-stranded DNA-binding protein [Oscillospiraceae bacterium]|nr:single-stranded DNA-binding protein [Oscillospiraceae bacterium]HPS75131.1 single-stranded DNA-binding protein [Oscillospiraceae bacterium]
MEEITTVNYAELCGVLAAPPAYSHSSRGEDFYVFPLDTKRLSGATDRINVVIRKELLGLELAEAAKLRVVGELRSFNNKRGGGARLVITVYARDIALCDDEDANLVCLSGTLCKQPNLRTTPMGRDICDLMLAVNRRYGRSDYLPCITWGLRAREAALWQIGDTVRLTGRIQSRGYIKLIDGEAYERTAYEVSVVEIEKLP